MKSMQKLLNIPHSVPLACRLAIGRPGIEAQMDRDDPKETIGFGGIKCAPRSVALLDRNPWTAHDTRDQPCCATWKPLAAPLNFNLDRQCLTNYSFIPASKRG